MALWLAMHKVAYADRACSSFHGWNLRPPCRLPSVRAGAGGWGAGDATESD